MEDFSFDFKEIELNLKQIDVLNLEYFIKLAKANCEKVEFGSISANNVENIETGVSGYLLFLLQYYKKTKDNEIFEKIISITNDLIAYCVRVPTNNFSLYTGRGGFCYFLLQLYEYQKKHAWLKNCVEMIQQSEDFLGSSYTSDYLYNGRAGLVVVLLRLFQLTRSEKIASLINLSVAKIIENAQDDEKGMSWRAKEEINLQNSCGFAHGAAGVLYVFKSLNACFACNVFSYIIQRAELYISNCKDSDSGKWFNYEKYIHSESELKSYLGAKQTIGCKSTSAAGNLSWNNGSAGIGIALGTTSLAAFEKSLFNEEISWSIYSGIAGNMLSVFHESDSSALPLKKFGSNLPIQSFSLEGGLLFGDLGIYYLMLNLALCDQQSIIAPVNFPLRNFNFKLDIDTEEFNRMLLRKSHVKTITFLEVNAPEILNTFLLGLRGNILPLNVIPFHSFIGDRHNFNGQTLLYEIVSDVYNYEINKNLFIHQHRKSAFSCYLDTLIYRREILKKLNEPADASKQQWMIADGVQIFQSKWDWSETQPFKYALNINRPVGFYEYIFLYSYEKEEVVEIHMTLDAMILHLFGSGAAVSDVIAECKKYFFSQPRHVQQFLASETGSVDIDHFFERIDFLVNDVFRNFVYSGVLCSIN